MPTTANLERLSALRTSLQRLAAVQRGELIRAEDWNTVVSALLDLAQAVLGEDASSVLPPHEHKEQVALTWLEPGLRTVLEKGPLGDPVSVDRMLRLERQVATLAARMNGVDDGVTGVRNRLAEVVTRDLVRENDVNTVRSKVDGVADSREDVLALRRSLDTVSVQVKAANDAAARLTIDGQPADLGALAGRLADVEKTRDGLRQSNGEVLSAAALETRFSQLSNTLVTGAQLDAALASRTAEVSADQVASLKSGLQATLSQEVADSVGRAQGELSASIASKLADVDAAASRAVSDALPALQKSAQESANASVATAIAKSQADTAALLDKRLADSATATGKLLDARFADVQGSLKSTVQQELSLQLPSQFSTFNGQLDQLAKALALQGQRLDSADAALKATQIRIDDFELSTSALFAETKSGLLAQMSQDDAAQAQLFTQQLKNSEAASQAATKSMIETSKSDILKSVAVNPALSSSGTFDASTAVTPAGGKLTGGGASVPFSGGNLGGLSAGGGLVKP